MRSGVHHACAGTRGSSIDRWCWNAFGQATDQSGSTFVAVEAGDIHPYPISAAGSVTCWGNDDYGQLGVPQELVYSIDVDSYPTCGMTQSSDVVW